MDEAIRFMNLEGGRSEVLPLWEVVFALLLSLVCSLVVGLVYRHTHRSVSYSQSYVQTLVLTSMVTTLIMIVIGSNIARAFSLVGALSIIRFRNAIKETRDVGYIFLSMAVAMASGTRFYTVAIVATLLISAVMIVLSLSDYGSSRLDPERLLRVRLPAGLDPASALEEVFGRLFLAYSLVLVESSKQGLNVDAVYSVRARQGVGPAQVLEEIAKVNGNLKVSYHYGAHTEDL